MSLTATREGDLRPMPEWQCSVQLVDVFGKINNRFQHLEKRLISAFIQLISAEAAVIKLAPPFHLLGPASNSSPDDLSGARQFIDSVYSY